MLTKEDLIVLYLDNPEKLYKRFWSKIDPVNPTDALLEVVLNIGDPELAYYYSAYVDKKPRDSTRKLACKEPMYAYLYARNIDEGFHEDTYEGVQKSLWYRRRYAESIC